MCVILKDMSVGLATKLYKVEEDRNQSTTRNRRLLIVFYFSGSVAGRFPELFISSVYSFLHRSY